MEDAQILSRYEALLALTERMHIAATTDDWQALGELEAERESHIAALQQLDPMASATPDFVRAKRRVLERLIAMDQKMVELCGQRKQMFQETLGALPAFRRAATAYGHNG